MKRISIVVLAAVLMLCFAACEGNVAEKQFTKGNITVTLTSAFKEKEVENVPFYLESKKSIFMANAEEKSNFSGLGITDLRGYIDRVLEVGEKTAEVLEFNGEDTRFFYAYYTSKVGLVTYGYMLVTLEGENHFYTVNFACIEKELEGNKSQYLEWAKTVKVV